MFIITDQPKCQTNTPSVLYCVFALSRSASMVKAEWRFRLVWFLLLQDTSQVICSSLLSVARVNCPSPCGNASTVADTRLPCSLASASCSFCAGMSNLLGSPVWGLLLSCGAFLAELRTNCQYTFHNPRNEINACTLRGAF